MEENFVILNMDEERELRWTFAAIKSFEKRGREILARLKYKTDKGQDISTVPMDAKIILSNYMKLSDITEAALASATGLSNQEGKKGEPSEASQAIEAYIEKGGSIDKLQEELYRAFLGVADPFYLEEWEQGVLRMRADQAKRLEFAKSLSGSPPSESPLSS